MEPSEHIVIICSSPGVRAALKQLVPTAETHKSAAEAMLSVARRDLRAVVLNVGDVVPAEHDLLAALRRARPDVPVYAVVGPEDEPLARGLLSEGAADYFVFPGDVARLPRALFPPPPAAPAQPQGPPPPEPAGRARLFDAACAIAGLALADPQAILRSGATIIVRAFGAERGCLMAVNPQSARLEVAAAVGAGPGAAEDAFEGERAIAERSLRTGETLLLESGGAPGRGPGGALLCAPVRESDETPAVLCIIFKAGVPVSREDRDAAAALALALGQQYRAAVQRQQFARLALRDSETGLLKADAFNTFLMKLMIRAAAQKAEVAVAAIEPESGGGPYDALVMDRLGRAVCARLSKGQQGARLSAGRFAVAWSRPATEGKSADERRAELATEMRRLAGAAASPDSPRLETSLAVFPQDGADAEMLLAAAEAGLGAAG